MLAPVNSVVLVLHMIAFMAGLMGNMFILIVNFMGWIKNSSDLSSCDLILSSLVVANIGHLCVFFANNICQIFWNWIFYQDHVMEFFFFPLFCLRCSSLWFSTWFCIYCCVKIISFTHLFLARLVTRFLEKVPWLLLGSVLVSLATCLPLAFTSQIQPADNVLSNISIGTASNDPVSAFMSASRIVDRYRIRFTVYIIISSLIFAIFAFSAVAIITTLCRHMKRMEQNADSFRNPRLDAHLGAVKTVTSLLILYSSLPLAQCIMFLQLAPPNSPLFTASYLMMAFFPGLNSIILILGIAKLKKTLFGIIFLANCCRRDRP